MGTPIVNLDALIDTIVSANVSANIDVQTTLEAKQEVLDAVVDTQAILDSVDTTVSAKKVELDQHTAIKKTELDTHVDSLELGLSASVDSKVDEYDANALNRVTQYNDNHIDKLTIYNSNDAIKINEYNANHIDRLEDINYAYADRIIQMLKTKRVYGMIDQYVAQTEVHMIPFLSTDDANYVYYGNGTKLELGVDYTIYDTTTIELVVKTNPYDVITQINTAVLGDMLLSEEIVLEDRIGVANGVAGLDANGQVPIGQLPSYVDDVIEVSTYADLPVTGEVSKIYVVIADETSGNNTSSYRWSGTVYAMVSNTLTAEDIKALYESNANTNEFTDAEKQKLADTEIITQLDIRDVNNRNVDNHVDGTTNGVYTLSERSKLGTIEENAKDDQTAEEIETLYEGLLDTNKFTDAEKTKLSDTEITSQLNDRDTANRDRTNHTGTQDLDTITETVDKKVMTAAERDKLVGIETNATADQTAQEIETLYEGLADTNKYTDAEKLEVAASTLHNTSDGSDHTFIDQDVTTTGTPKFNSIQLNGGVGTQGLMTWNTDEETVDLVLDGAVLQIGQEFIVNVRNDTASTIPNGVPVMMTATVGNSSRLLIAPLDVSNSNNVMNIIGVSTVEIAAGADGKATMLGKVRGINTTGSSVGETWLDKDVLYAHPTIPGKFTKIAPASNQVSMPIAVVINAHSSGSIFVRALPYNMNEINAAIVANYYDKAAIDLLLEAQNDASGIAVAPQGNLSSTTVQLALQELQEQLDTLTVIEEW